MTRSLNKSVLAGGVVYPAGTPATPELEAAITNPAHWAGEPSDPSEAAPRLEVPADVPTPDTAGTEATETPAAEVDTKTDIPVTQEGPRLDEIAGQEPAEEAAPVDTSRDIVAEVPVDTKPPAKAAAPARKAPAKKATAKKATAKKTAKKATGS